MNKKQRDVVEAIKGGFRLGRRGETWVLHRESRTGKLTKNETQHPSHRECEKMVGEGLLTFRGHVEFHDGDYEHYGLARTT
jgi:hypothetical protein